MNVSSSFTFIGDDSAATLNTLTHVTHQDTSKTLANLVPDTNSSRDYNSANQTIFMNQPISWWLAELNSGAVKYTPLSNTVNWAYKNGNATYYIGKPVTDALIPNRVLNVAVDRQAKTSTTTFEPKLGVSRTDVRTGV